MEADARLLRRLLRNLLENANGTDGGVPRGGDVDVAVCEAARAGCGLTGQFLAETESGPAWWWMTMARRAARAA